LEHPGRVVEALMMEVVARVGEPHADLQPIDGHLVSVRKHHAATPMLRRAQRADAQPSSTNVSGRKLVPGAVPWCRQLSAPRCYTQACECSNLIRANVC